MLQLVRPMLLFACRELKHLDIPETTPKQDETRRSTQQHRTMQPGEAGRRDKLDTVPRTNGTLQKARLLCIIEMKTTMVRTSQDNSELHTICVDDTYEMLLVLQTQLSTMLHNDDLDSVACRNPQ